MKNKRRRRDRRKKKKDGNLAYLGSKKKQQPQKDKGVDASDISWDAAGSKGVGKLTQAVVQDAGTYKVTGTTVEASRIIATTVVSTKIRSRGFWGWLRRLFS